MSLICLVHGSTQAASGWERLVLELQRRGRRVVCAELPANEPEASTTRVLLCRFKPLRKSWRPTASRLRNCYARPCLALASAYRRAVASRILRSVSLVG